MATIGGLGGLGGFSYPYRFGNPNSQVVEALPFATYGDWQSDWQSRYDAEAARATAPSTVESQPSMINYGQPVASAPAGWTPESRSASNPSWMQQRDDAKYGVIDVDMGGGQNAKINTNYTATSPTSADATGSSLVGRNLYDVQAPQTTTSGGYTPDFSALNAERERFEPLYENQTRQSQAYGMMRGQGQENAVLGPDYQRPDFGQINGQPQGQNTAGFPGAGQIPGLNGIDMSWADGSYNPQEGGSGVYGVSPQAGKQWGLW